MVIAMDENQEPVGDYVYLTPEFYERLHKLTDAEAAQLPDWLLVSARYHLPRPPRVTGPAPNQDEIDVQIELATFRGGVQVELPFRRDQISLLEGRTRLDGEPAAVTWRGRHSAAVRGGFSGKTPVATGLRRGSRENGGCGRA